MKNLEKVVLSYLQKPTDYALQINSEWGKGKTYYYKEVLEKLIAATPIYKDNLKKYKPIYISLFGIKSSEEIATKIVFDFYQFKYFKKYLNKKTLSITERVLKLVLEDFYLIVD